MLICNRLIFSSSSDCQKADITFLIDASGSITEKNRTNWALMLEFLQDVVKSPILEIGRDNVQIAAVKYSNVATVQFYLDETVDPIQVAEKIKSIKYVGGRTNIAHALELARTYVFNESRGDRSDVRDIIILVTDGMANERVDDTLIQSELAKKVGIYIVCVGITDAINEKELRLMSSNNETVRVKDFASLSSILADLVEVACQLPPPGK